MGSEERSEKTRVVNVRREQCDVYIGRACAGWPESPWANPFRIRKPEGVLDRFRVLEQFREYLRTRPDLLDRLSELEGKKLGCWCHPKPCHGDVLVELVEARRR